jgi:HK97 family phage major capsid protein
MKTISQYKEDIKNLMAKIAEFDAQAVNENRDLTAAELQIKNEMLDTVDDLTKIVETLERQERVQQHLDNPEDSVTTPMAASRNTGSSVLVGDDRAARERFASFGEQMAAVMRAGVPGGSVDPRLFNAATGASESVPSDGGFLVQQDFSAEILQETFETGILVSRCRKIPISGTANSIKINGIDETSRASSRYGGIIGYWADEAEEKTASKPKFRKIELTLKKLVGLCYATDELLEDAAALEGVIRSGFVAEFGFLLDDAIFNGTGAGQPLGILNAGCLVTVSKEAGQAADTVVAENVVKMRSRLFASSRANSVWLVNQNVEPQLHTMSLAVGTGGVPVYMPAGGLSGQPFDTLYGRPVLPIEHAATLGDLGDIVLADFTNGYILAEKGGIKSDMSIHVRFVYDESVFRFVLRVDGQPVRASALTPFKGGANFTQSHFITLEAR